MIDKVNSKQFQELVPKSASQDNSVETQNNTRLDVSLQVNYASLIKKAMESPESDENAVQQAQELLSSGELESEQTIRTVAETIIKLGV